VRRVGGRWIIGEPKTEAGHRTVTLPASIAAVLEDHLEKHVAASPDALLFPTSSGGYLARSNWNSTFRRAADAIGLPAVRPHELRHTGATLAASTGATTKELMRRLGHSSPAAALLYQHAAEDRDAEIAQALDGMLEAIRRHRTTAPTSGLSSAAARRLVTWWSRGRSGKPKQASDEHRRVSASRLPSWPCRFDPGHPLHIVPQVNRPVRPSGEALEAPPEGPVR
jgi:hypothetical protein